MCPLCIGSTVLLLGSAGSAGGLAALAARIVRGTPAPRTGDSQELRITRASAPAKPAARSQPT